MASKPSLYLLQLGFCGNFPTFWREGGAGYTPDIDQAQRWTWKQAQEQILASRGSHSFRALKLSDCEAAVVRVVDSEKMKRGKR